MDWGACSSSIEWPRAGIRSSSGIAGIYPSVYGANPPFIDNLHHPLRRQLVPLTKFSKRPAADEVQAHRAPLNIGPRLLLEDWNLRGEAYPTIPDRQAKCMTGQLLQIHGSALER
jgi:hypothetical protein